MGQILTEPRTDFDAEVAARRDDEDSDYSGWYCIATDPFPCPAEGCGFVAMHMTGAHLVVAWPERDDSLLLGAARSAASAGRNPRVVEYEQAFGPCIAYDEWDRLGRPVHGVRSDRPDGYEPMRRL